MSKIMNIAVIIIFFLAVTGGHSRLLAITGRDIMLKVDDRPDGDDRSMEMAMTLINKRDKKRIRSMLFYSRDYGKDVKSIFYFQKPADVKGTAFLSWGYDNPDRDDDRWLYLPAMKKTRRISGKSKNDYFMGSDLTYDDMGNRSVDEDTHQLLREEKLNDFDCWVIESIPNDKDYMYSRVITWIRKDALIGVKRDFYDRQGRMLKTMTRTDVRLHQGFWTAFKTEVHNVQENHRTILEITNAFYDLNLKDSLFRVSTLERGRLK